MLEDVRPLVTALITAGVTIVGAATPLVVVWLKNYFSVRENAAMNATIAAAASREAALLLSSVTDIRQVNSDDPMLAGLAMDLMKHYPEYTEALGLDPARVQRIILGEAHKLFNSGIPVSAAAMATAPKGAPTETRSVPRR